jgi:hypothetical protein
MAAENGLRREMTCKGIRVSELSWRGKVQCGVCRKGYKKGYLGYLSGEVEASMNAIFSRRWASAQLNNYQDQADSRISGDLSDHVWTNAEERQQA